MDGIAETVGIKTPKEIGMHFSFLPGETSVVITCEKGNGSFSKGTKGVGSSNHLDYDDLWACAFAFTDWINNKYLSN
ncbi:MAG: hypothetical protein PF549_01985 [Patescibacteria group bacterium]|nr:hypothetical protein [Patescibacteria group bacterium]